MKLTAFKKILPKASALLLSLVLTFMLMIGAASADSAGTTPIYSKADLFTERDMIQEADLSEAEMISVTSGEDVRITSAGVYVLSGTASETTVYVEADSEDKVQLVLKGLNITNESFPCIYVITADKVFLTTSADSSLTVTAFAPAHGPGFIFSVRPHPAAGDVHGAAAVGLQKQALQSGDGALEGHRPGRHGDGRLDESFFTVEFHNAPPFFSFPARRKGEQDILFVVVVGAWKLWKTRILPGKPGFFCPQDAPDRWKGFGENQRGSPPVFHFHVEMLKQYGPVSRIWN